MITEENTSDGTTSLHSEIRNFCGDIDCIENLLKHHVSDINTRNSQGETPLHLAAQNQLCSVELVKLLLNHGADVKATTREGGNTALHLLAMSYKGSQTSIGVVDILLKHGINVNAVNSRGDTSLHLAVRNKFLFHDLSLIKVLIRHKADVCIKDAMKDNAYQAYCRFWTKYNRANDLVVTLLLMPPNELWRFKITPLHKACLCHHFDLVYKLLSIGVDVNLTDNFGNTPLYYAAIAPGEVDKSILALMFIYGAVIIQDRYRALTFGWDIAGYSNFTLVSSSYSISISNYKILANVFYQYLAKSLPLWHIHKRIKTDVNDIMKDMVEKYDEFWTSYSEVTTIVSCYVKEYKDLLTRCNEEVKLMRETKIGKTNVSFVDLLLSVAEKTMIYSKNKELIKGFNDKKRAMMFPIYQGMLDAKIEKYILRQKLIEKAVPVLIEAFGFPETSDEFFERTLSYCTTQDIIHVILMKMVE